jgi:hypothetical protein
MRIGETKIIGAYAKALLDKRNLRGHVLAVVTHAAYLRDVDGEIVWLAEQAIPMHRRAILGQFDLTGLRVGMPVRIQSGYLRFGEEKGLEIAGAPVWQPESISPDRVARPKIVNLLVQQLLDIARASNRSESLDQLLPLIAADDNDLGAGKPTNPFLRAALEPIYEIVQACRSRDMERVALVGRALVGLGPGLTPSGDDFLGGLFFVANQLKQAYPTVLHYDEMVIDELLASARERTNSISLTILGDHVRGHAVQPLHELGAAMLQGQELPMQSLQTLIAIGSTSGWDILTGALAGTLLIAGLDQPMG